MGTNLPIFPCQKPQRWAGTGWRWSGKVSLSPGGPPNQRGEGLAAPLSIPSPVPCPWQARCHQVNMGWIHQPHCWLNPLAYKLYKGFPSRLLRQRRGRQVEEKTDLRGVSAGVFLPSQPPLGISWCTGGISELISSGSTTTTCLRQPDAPAQPCDFVPRLDNGEWRTLVKLLNCTLHGRRVQEQSFSSLAEGHLSSSDGPWKLFSSALARHPLLLPDLCSLAAPGSFGALLCSWLLLGSQRILYVHKIFISLWRLQIKSKDHKTVHRRSEQRSP